MKCEHKNFASHVNVGRLTDFDGNVTNYSADVTVTCFDCKQPFRFLGLPIGSRVDGATMSADGIEARLALTPATIQNHPLGCETVQ